MKQINIVMLFILMGLTACASPRDNNVLPDTKEEFNVSQAAVRSCLAEQLVELIQVSPTPEMAINVSVTRCKGVAFDEGERLKRLFVYKTRGRMFTEVMIGMEIPNSNRSITEGFVKSLTSNSNLKTEAENVLLSILQELEKM